MSSNAVKMEERVWLKEKNKNTNLFKSAKHKEAPLMGCFFAFKASYVQPNWIFSKSSVISHFWWKIPLLMRVPGMTDAVWQILFICHLSCIIFLSCIPLLPFCVEYNSAVCWFEKCREDDLHFPFINKWIS